MGLELRYFVLKPVGKGAHAKASRKAILAYAKAIEKKDEVLADDLRLWVRDEKERIKS